MIRRIEDYYRCFVDCWRLFKEYRDPVETLEFWMALTKSANVIYTRYRCQPYKKSLAKQILFAVLDEIDRIGERKMREGKAQP